MIEFPGHPQPLHTLNTTDRNGIIAVSDHDERQPHEISLRESITRNVSEQALMLEEMRIELQQSPDVDLDKVAQIRQQLQDGTFKLDLSELANAINGYHGKDVSNDSNDVNLADNGYIAE